MKKLVFGAIAIPVLSGAAIAARYRANSLYRMYSSDPAKTHLVGEAWLPCPTTAIRRRVGSLKATSRLFHGRS